MTTPESTLTTLATSGTSCPNPDDHKQPNVLPAEVVIDGVTYVPMPEEDDENPWLRANRLARKQADLLETLANLKQEFADHQEYTAKYLAALRLDTGKTIELVTDEVYDDKDRVVQRLKDRVWNEGYLEGLRSAVSHLNNYHITETHSVSEGTE